MERIQRGRPKNDIPVPRLGWRECVHVTGSAYLRPPSSVGKLCACVRLSVLHPLMFSASTANNKRRGRRRTQVSCTQKACCRPVAAPVRMLQGGGMCEPGILAQNGKARHPLQALAQCCEPYKPFTEQFCGIRFTGNTLNRRRNRWRTLNQPSTTLNRPSTPSPKMHCTDAGHALTCPP